MNWKWPIAAGLILASPLGATVTDLIPAHSPLSELVDAGPGKVTTGGTGNFLVHGQRISPDGDLLDPEPVPGADGFAVPWPDGWLVINSQTTTAYPYTTNLYVLHLRDEGPPELIESLPALDSPPVLAAANGGRLAIVERVSDGELSETWISISDGAQLLSRRKLNTKDRLSTHQSLIAPFREGFIVVTSYKTNPYSWRWMEYEVSLLDRDGFTVSERRLHHYQEEGEAAGISVQGENVLLSIHGSQPVAIVLDASLQASALLAFSSEPSSHGFALPLGTDRFLLSYTLGEDATSSIRERAAVIGIDGTLISDEPAYAIASGAASGDRYLVVRPWGDAAIAEGDPRRVITPAIDLKRRKWRGAISGTNVISGDVSLFYTANEFVRVDSSGRAVDGQPKPRPSGAIAATPEGFAIVSLASGSIRMQRLARRGDWIDRVPVEIAVDPAAIDVAAFANDFDLLVAWVSDKYISWSRFAFDGTPIQLSERVPYDTRDEWNYYDQKIGITGNPTGRLLMVQSVDYCQQECFGPPTHVTMVAVDNGGRRFGSPHRFESYAREPRAVALPDRTWIYPMNNGEVLHVARDTKLLRRIRMPEPDFYFYFVDFTSTPTGWRAIVTNIQFNVTRMVEFAGADHLRGVVGIPTTVPRFATGNRVALIAKGPGLEGVPILWTGRLTTSGISDLTISATRRSGFDQVSVRNDGPDTARDVVIHGGSRGAYRKSIGTIAPGETADVSMPPNHGVPDRWDLYWALSSDSVDPDYSDNTTLHPR